MTVYFDYEIIAVHDAIAEARIDQGREPDFAAAIGFIPDEFHQHEPSARGRFIAAVINNARAAKLSPYSVALFAFDLS